MSEATARNNGKNGGRSRLDQAAILLLSIGEDAAAKVMQKMSREEVVLLSETMARLHDVKLIHARSALNTSSRNTRSRVASTGLPAAT